VKIDAARKAGATRAFTIPDSPYWFCLIFDRQEQKNLFLEKLWPKTFEDADKYIDGVELAKQLGLKLPKATVRTKKAEADDEEILAYVTDHLVEGITVNFGDGLIVPPPKPAVATVTATKPPARTTVFEAAAKRKEFFNIVLDWDFWCCVCFASPEQCDFFLKAVWPGVPVWRQRFIDGMALAAKLGIALPEMKMPPSTVKPHPELAALALTLEEAHELHEWAARRRQEKAKKKAKRP